MKILQLSILFSLICSAGFSQINLEKVADRQKKKTEKKIENRIEKRIDKGVDKTLDKTEEGIEDAVKGDGEKQAAGAKGSAKTGASSKTATNKSSEPAPVATSQEKPVVTWNKYDFVPGTEIIFEDNQDGEQNGEFPSKWDLTGGTIENANVDGTNVIMFRKCNINGTDGIVPLIKNAAEDYLPDEFTIEFDAYFEKYSHTYRIYLLDTKNQRNLIPENSVSNRHYLRFNQHSADGKNISTSYYPGFDQSNLKSLPGWRHIALSFNKRALKIYIDDARVINVPNIGYNPSGLTLGFHNTTGTINGYVKNIRIAKGAVPLYDKLLTDGRFVTTGIKFDVNKAVIKPESMGTINYVVKILTDHPELKFSVEGHTDSDGDDASNLKLSEARAKAIMDKLTEMGISSDRLRSKGWGETKPLTGNDTSEGKAQNRKVEFVKI
ncbi:MAG: OmpA family protein [Bacteroidales bacterium]|nr:OmpA family protein [Bacteroidales bacterium]